MNFYDCNWSPTYEKDREWLEGLIDIDPEKFADCVIEVVDANDIQI
jgi:hypothetical protein